MKALYIGSQGRSEREDRVVQFNQATLKFSSGSRTTRPQLCIELTGGSHVIQVYAASEAAYQRLGTLLGCSKPVVRLVPGNDVLGIHLHWPPRGWPEEAQGSSSVRRAPESLITSASATLPDKAAIRYPFQIKPGIEVVSLSPTELVKSKAYHREDAVTMRNKNVTVTFGGQNQGMTKLHMETANADLAVSLAGSIARKTGRRLMINQSVLGICMVFANGTRLTLGAISSHPKDKK